MDTELLYLHSTLFKDMPLRLKSKEEMHIESDKIDVVIYKNSTMLNGKYNYLLSGLLNSDEIESMKFVNSFVESLKKSNIF